LKYIRFYETCREGDYAWKHYEGAIHEGVLWKNSPAEGLTVQRSKSVSMLSMFKEQEERYFSWNAVSKGKSFERRY
jgi:hypothetical protein